MKHLIQTALALFVLSLAASCSSGEDYSWIKNGLDTARTQLFAAAAEAQDSGKTPCTVRTYYSMKDFDFQMGNPVAESYDDVAPTEPLKTYLCAPKDWRSGFFSGSLWYIYELTKDKQAKEYAIDYTNRLEPLRRVTTTHDLGFMSYCSYGNALRLSPNDTIKSFLKETSDNLIARFKPEIGCIRSWDSRNGWNFAVIIDNMMNLELLFNESKMTGDPKYRDIAITHANTTIANHFRDDYTTFHVVSYNDDGSVQVKCTHQGRSDDSAWARGQAWGFYGYTMCYRETGDEKYLAQARHIGDMIMEKVTTEDAIPYWDYSAPATDKTPRDASAAAVTASGMIELSTLVPDGEKYFAYGEKILKSLSSEAYLAAPGTNWNFVLMHSVTSMPSRSEVDAPLNYADYYYLEGLKRYMAVKGLKYKNL